MSIFPPKLVEGIAKEAQGSKVSISLMLIIALLYGAFHLGSEKSQEVKEATDKIDKMEITLERVSTVLEKLEERQSEQGKTISSIEERTHSMNTDIVVMSTKMEEMYGNSRKKKR